MTVFKPKPRTYAAQTVFAKAFFDAGGSGLLVWVDPSVAAQIQDYHLLFSASVSDFHTDTALNIARFQTINISAAPTLLAWN